MSDVVEIIVTGPPDFMPGLVEALVRERLIACGQLTPIDSTYRWQGNVEHAAEIRAAMHTTAAHAKSVMRHVRAAHPYETPCIIVMPVLLGEGSYVRWVINETRADA